MKNYPSPMLRPTIIIQRKRKEKKGQGEKDKNLTKLGGAYGAYGASANSSLRKNPILRSRCRQGPQKLIEHLSMGFTTMEMRE